MSSLRQVRESSTSAENSTGSASEVDAEPVALPCNLRDLGGLATEDGGCTRSKVALRSDDVSRARSVTVAELVTEHGIRDIIDLRSHNELARLGRGVTYELPVRYHHLPMQLGARGRNRQAPALPRTPEELGDFYAGTIETAALALRFAVEVVADGTAGVLFHCVGGKDRAGLLAALLLTAAGVTREEIVSDYARTADHLSVLRRSVLGPDGGVAGATGVFPAGSLPPVMLEAPATAMHTCLDRLTQRHGSVLAPLHETGLSSATLRALQQRLVDGPVDEPIVGPPPKTG